MDRPHPGAGPAAEPECPRALRRLWLRHVALTLTVFGPLAWAFLTVNNFYPIAVWSLFSEAPGLAEGEIYWVLRGETTAGETIDLAPIGITDALTGRIAMMVYYVATNAQFRIASPHPANAALLGSRSPEALPRAAGMPALLRSWGASYNARIAAGSPRRLAAIRLDEYEWPGGRYADYRRPRGSWRVALGAGR